MERAKIDYGDGDGIQVVQDGGVPVTPGQPQPTEQTPKPDGIQMMKDAKQGGQPQPEQPQAQPNAQPNAQPDEAQLDAEIESHFAKLMGGGQATLPTPEIKPTPEPQYEAPDVPDDEPDEIEQKVTQTVQSVLSKREAEESQKQWINSRKEASKQVYKKYPEILQVEKGEKPLQESGITTALREAYQVVNMNDPDAPLHAMRIAELKLGISSAKEEGAREEHERNTRVTAQSALTSSGGYSPAPQGGQKLPELSQVEATVAQKLRLRPETYSQMKGQGRSVVGSAYYQRYSNERDPRFKGNNLK